MRRFASSFGHQRSSRFLKLKSLSAPGKKPRLQSNRRRSPNFQERRLGRRLDERRRENDGRALQKFVVTLETQLENPTVYLINPREKTVVSSAKFKGGFGGVITLVVET